MTIRSALLRAVTVAALLGLALAARLDGFPWLVAAGVGVVALWRLGAAADGRALVRRKPRLVLEALAVVLGVLLLHRLAVGDPQPLIALLVALALLQGLALIRAQSPFTSFVVVLFSTIHAAGAAFLRQDVPALFLTAAYLVFLAWSLVLFERDAASRRAERTRGAVRRYRVGSPVRLPSGAILRTVVGLCALGFLGGATLYLLAPRGVFEEDEVEREHALRMGPADDGGEVGATDAESFASGEGSGTMKGIRLGDIGTIKLDLTPFFEVLMPPGRRPWLRENTYDVYKRGDWSAFEGPETRAVQSMHPGVGGWLDLGREDDRVRGYGVRIRVYRGPQSRLYLERDAVRVRVLRRTNKVLPTILRRLDNEQVESYLELEAGFVIEERVVPPVTDPNALEAARSDATVSPRESYVVLPPECEPLRDLARQVVGAETNAWKRAKLLQLWLKSEAFTYTLKMPEVSSETPVVDFLREKRSGHCEYFASSMTLLLRALGHPSRIVRGFRGGDWLEDRGTWMIRGLHYHAWTEMYFAGLGWIPVDATPPDREADDADFSVTAAADTRTGKESGDLAKRFLGYSREDRKALRAAVGRFLNTWVVEPLAFAFGRRGYWFGWGLVILGMVLYVRRHRRTRVARAIGVPRRALPEGPYGRALALLARKGLRRRNSQTPGEFELAVAKVLPAVQPSFEPLTRLYERERFGGVEPDKNEAREARSRVQELEEITASMKSRRRR